MKQSDRQPQYRELRDETAEPYRAACREAFGKLSVRHDVQIKGPVAYRDIETRQVMAVYNLGFISRFVTTFDAGSPPRITETYFENYDTKRRTKEIPRSLKPAEQTGRGDGDKPSN